MVCTVEHAGHIERARWASLRLRPRTGRVVAALAVAVLAAVVPAAIAEAYAGDNSNPTSCASPTNLKSASISRSGVTVGVVQLRFSDPCNTSWNRTCAASGYTAHYGAGERFVYPAIVDYFLGFNWEFNQSEGTNNCSGTGLTGHYTYTKAWFNDCQEAGLGSCKSRAAGQVSTTGWTGSNTASE